MGIEQLGGKVTLFFVFFLPIFFHLPSSYFSSTCLCYAACRLLLLYLCYVFMVFVVFAFSVFFLVWKKRKKAGSFFSFLCVCFFFVFAFFLFLVYFFFALLAPQIFFLSTIRFDMA